MSRPIAVHTDSQCSEMSLKMLVCLKINRATKLFRKATRSDKMMRKSERCFVCSGGYAVSVYAKWKWELHEAVKEVA